MNKIEQAIKKISSGQPMNCACEYCERDRWAYELALAALNEQLGTATCKGCKNELESRDKYPCNCCLRNEVLFADNYEDDAALTGGIGR